MGEILSKKLKSNKIGDLDKEAVLNLLVASNYVKNLYEEICNDFRITGSQYNVLRILKGTYPDGYARCDIIERMLDPSPDVTRLIDRLEKAKLVERFSSTEDRRLSKAKITEKGLELLKNMDSEISKFDRILTDILTKEEMRQLSGICEKIYSKGKEF